MVLSREKMRLYQRERRRRLCDNLSIGIRKDDIQNCKTLEELKAIRKESVPVYLDGLFIYCLFKGDEIVYVGKYKSLLTRMRCHKTGNCSTEGKEFDSVAFVESSTESINADEYRYIRVFNPKYNKIETRHFTNKSKNCPKCLEKDKQIEELEKRLRWAERNSGIEVAAEVRGGALDKLPLRAEPAKRVITDSVPVSKQPKHHDTCQCMVCEIRRK